MGENSSLPLVTATYNSGASFVLIFRQLLIFILTANASVRRCQARAFRSLNGLIAIVLLGALMPTLMPTLAWANTDLVLGTPISTLPSFVDRPKVALVLSGGGARGFAHIGVLKVLQSARVPVDFVVGTSMGAVVGGSYAGGNPLERIERLARNADWNQLLADRPPRDALSFQRKEDDRRLIGGYELGITDKGLTLPRGAIGSHLLEEVLRRLALPGQHARNLDELVIPLRTVTTNLVDGTMEVLTDVTLFQAMRASMSVPGAFAPMEIQNKLLVDGGLVRNLPIDVARQLGADIIIAVNVGTPLLPRSELDSALGVAQQMVNILTEQNVTQSLAQLSERDVLISPDLKDITAADFQRLDDSIQRGMAAAKLALPRLLALQVPQADYEAWEAVRTSSAAPGRAPVITEVRIDGTQRANPDILKRELGLEPGSPANERLLTESMRRLFGRGEFERIDFVLDGSGDARRLLVLPRELPWNAGNLRLGFQFSSDFQDAHQVSFAAVHRVPWVNRWGAQWRNYAQLGSTRRLESEFMQPLAPDSHWYASARFAYEGYYRDLWQEHRRVGRQDISNALLGLFIGRNLGQSGDLQFGSGLSRGNTSTLIGETSASDGTENRRVWLSRVRWDTIDNLNFPRQGQFIDLDLRRREGVTGAASSVDSLKLQADWATAWGPHAILWSLRHGASRGGLSPYILGGFMNLSGTGVNELSNERTLLLRAQWLQQLGPLPRSIGTAWYGGLSLELGQAYGEGQGLRWDAARRAATLLLGLDSTIGPIYFGLGRSQHGQTSAYFYVGRP